MLFKVKTLATGRHQVSLTTTFWSHFEEGAVSSGRDKEIDKKTATGRKEEECQRISTLHGLRPTFTETREEPDQDESHSSFCSIPRARLSTATKTITKTREEKEQDEATTGYRAVPR